MRAAPSRLAATKVPRLVTLLVPALLAISIPHARADDAPTVVELQGADAASFTKSLGTNFTTIVREGDKVRIVSRNPLDNGSGTFVHELALKVGQGFHIPDKHATEAFVLTAATDAGIELAYEDRVDFRDFGVNKITHDRGTVKLPWKTK